MDEHTNPRNRADPMDELIFSTHLPEPSAAAAAAASVTRSLTTDTASPFEPLRSASDPRNRAPYSKKKTVLLDDWWLLSAPEAHEGRRLSVGGVVAERYRGPSQHEGDRSGSKFLLSPRHKAERVFESAPITKRYDSFTLGTADGITVRIQGVINKACSYQNRISLEVCNLFLIGFPYNWDKYAGACFEGKYNSASVPESATSTNEISEGLADTEGCLFPVHLDDFTLSRIHDGSVDGSATRKFRDATGTEYGKYKRRNLSACDLASARAVYFTLESSTTNLQIDPAPTSDTQGDRLADEQISMNTGHESEFLKSSIANKTESDTIMGINSSKEKIIDLSKTKIQNQSKRVKKKKQSPLSVYRAYKKGRSLQSSGRAIWRPSYDNRYPLTRDTAKKLSIASPESLNLKRSRSGRLLVPPIATWRQKIIYAANGEITGITGEGLENFPCIESQSEPPKKRKRLVY